MKIPTWVSWQGLAFHALAGGVLTFGLAFACPNPGAALFVAWTVGFVHEQAQGSFSDFRPENGGPWNGVLDIATFGLMPLIWALW